MAWHLYLNPNMTRGQSRKCANLPIMLVFIYFVTRANDSMIVWIKILLLFLCRICTMKPIKNYEIIICKGKGNFNAKCCLAVVVFFLHT